MERAVRKQDRGYPDSWDVAFVDSADWVSQVEAATQLGVSVMRLGLWVSSRRLTPAHSSTGQAGVTKESLDSVRRERLGAGPFRRFGQLIIDVWRCLVRGI